MELGERLKEFTIYKESASNVAIANVPINFTISI